MQFAVPTVHGAFQRLYMLERACELELLARQMNAEPVMVEPPVVHAAAERMKAVRDTDTYGLGPGDLGPSCEADVKNQLIETSVLLRRHAMDSLADADPEGRESLHDLRAVSRR